MRSMDALLRKLLAFFFICCRVCNAVAEAEAGPARGRLGKAAEEAGFTIERAVVEAVGVCPNCTAAA